MRRGWGKMYGGGGFGFGGEARDKMLDGGLGIYCGLGLG